MARPMPIDARGVLRTPEAGVFELRRWEPAPDLAATVVWLWLVRWDLRGRGAHEQVTLPHPSAHLVIEDGHAVLHGPASRRFERTLAGAGGALGARLRPGGVRPLLGGAPVASIADRSVPAAALAGLDEAALVRAGGGR